MKSIKKIVLAVTLLIPSIVFSQSSQTREVSSFTKIKISGSFDTYIEQGNKESVRIEAEQSVLEKIQTTVNNGQLKVFIDPKSHEKILGKVYIICRSLEVIDRAGSGDLTCKMNISGVKVEVGSSGSGDMNITGKISSENDAKISLSGSGDVSIANLKAENLEIALAGSGDVQVLSGTVKEESLHIAGSGDINASDLVSENSSVFIAGSGDANIHANGALTASIAGSGDLINKGTATVTSSKIAGSGRIRKN